LSLLLVLAPAALGVKPSENAGRRGTYQSRTSRPDYNYYVYVPRSYSEDNPAGLHLFFHGQGSQKGAASFDLWARDFLEPFNLIGINMQYMDGDNAKDASGKVASAIEAIMQTTADYKIIRGRGVVSSFSGGGIPHAMLVSDYAKMNVKRGTWPFNHCAPYDSNYRHSVKGLATMTWFLALGQNEWNLAGAGLGKSQTSRAEELFTEAAVGGCPDVYLKITKGKGHSISDADVADSARGFRRSDLAFCGFFCEEDFVERELESVVRDANRLELGLAAGAVRRLLAGEKISPELRKKAEFIGRRIDQRAEAVLKLSKELAENDALLCTYYGRIFAQQLKGHPRASELTKLLESARKNQKDTSWALELFARRLKDFFSSDGKLNPEAEGILKKVRTQAGENSLLGKMAGEFLELR
jgi:hypothetical protein